VAGAEPDELPVDHNPAVGVHWCRATIDPAGSGGGGSEVAAARGVVEPGGALGGDRAEPGTRGGAVGDGMYQVAARLTFGDRPGGSAETRAFTQREIRLSCVYLDRKGCTWLRLWG
jgi:hypothetical protein